MFQTSGGRQPAELPEGREALPRMLPTAAKLGDGQAVQLAAAQDNLRPLRNFVGFLSGAVNDQSWAGSDGYAVSPPGQFYSQTAAGGVAIEGRPALLVAPGGQQGGIPPLFLLAGAALVAYLLLK
ncbi:MAG: hypothetical protein J0L58_16840 [Burkholderiales bacterium]|nr:hypothetical protein [Burkholderiales bacterium]